MLKNKCLLILILIVHGEARPQVNPCLALKLPLCKIKTDFAQEHGIVEKDPDPPAPSRVRTQSNFSPTRDQSSFSPTSPPRRSQSTFTREGDTLIVTPSETIAQPEAFIDTPKRPTALRSSLLDRLRNKDLNRGSTNSNNDNDACKGLRFCVLKKNSGSSSPSRRIPTTTTEDPLLEQFLASANQGPSSGNLLNLILTGDLETAKQLIEEGADVNVEDQHGNSALHIAAQNGRGDIIEELVLNGADVNKGNNHKNTAIHLAAQNGWDEVAETLLKAKKLKINFKDLHANTALHLAAQNGQIGVAQKLIEAGADLNSPNAHKLVPLHLTAQNGHLELSKILVQAGADLDRQDLIGNTPLHTAYHNTQLQIAQYFAASGANERKRNLSGLTPVQLGK